MEKNFRFQLTKAERDEIVTNIDNLRSDMDVIRIAKPARVPTLYGREITSSKRTIQEQMMNLDLKAAYEYGMKWILRHEPITVYLQEKKLIQWVGSDKTDHWQIIME